MIELYIARHGRTSWNAQGKIQGSTDITLLDEGREMAQTTGAFWAASGLKFDAVYSSPLNRAYETAQLLSDYTGLPIVRDERLRELNFGELEGQTYLHLSDTEYDAAHGSFFCRPELYETPKNGESLEDICARGKSFLEDILSGHTDGQRILIVAHGAMNKALLRNIRGLELKDFWFGKLQKNCGVTIVQLDGKDYNIVEECAIFY